MNNRLELAREGIGEGDLGHSSALVHKVNGFTVGFALLISVYHRSCRPEAVDFSHMSMMLNTVRQCACAS